MVEKIRNVYCNLKQSDASIHRTRCYFQNKNLNIDSRSNNSKRPTVRISKAPIKIGQLNNDGIQLYEYAKELALKEAIFYFDEKRIPADLALEIIRKNDFETVETLPWTNRTPEVKIHSKT